MSSTTSLPPAVVVDANVVVSALIGGRAQLVLASPLGPTCIAASAVADEVLAHLPAIAERRGLDPTLVTAALAVIPIEWHAAADYDHHRAEAERLIAARDPDDWPTVALALATGFPIWTQDKDFSITGIEFPHDGGARRRNSGPARERLTPTA